MEATTRNTCPSVNFRSSKAEHVLDTLFHIFILSLVLQCLWVVMMRKIEKRLLNNEVKNALQAIIDPATSKLPIHMLPAKLFDFGKAWFDRDEATKEINSLIISRNWVLIEMLGLGCAAYYFTLKWNCSSKNSESALGHILLNNFVLLIIVGLVEAVFCFGVILHFVPTPPSFMAKAVLRRLEHISEAVANPDACHVDKFGTHWKKADAPPSEGVRETHEALVDAVRTSLHVPTSTLDDMGSVILAESYVQVGDDVYVPYLPSQTQWTTSCKGQFPKLAITAGYILPVFLLAVLIKVYNPADTSFNVTSIAWQGVLVSIVISVLFLTIGHAQEKLVMSSTIDRVVDKIVGGVYKGLMIASPSEAKRVVDDLARIQLPDMSLEDEKVRSSNMKLMMKTGVIVGTALAFALAVTGGEHAYRKAYKKGQKSNGILTIATSAGIAATCSFLAEFNFLVRVLARNRPLSADDVMRHAIDIMQKKAKGGAKRESPPPPPSTSPDRSGEVTYTPGGA